MSNINIDDNFISNLFLAQPQPAFWLQPLYNQQTGQIEDFRYSFCNDEMVVFTGLSKEEIIGKTIFSSLLIPNDELKSIFFTEILDVFNTGERSQGTLYNPNFNKYYSFTRQKVQGGILTVLQDRNEEYKLIRKLEQQAKELEEQKYLLDSILKHSPTGITVSEAVRDERGAVVDWRTIVVNEAAEKVAGQSKELLLHNTIKEVNPALWESPLSKAGIETLETGIPFITRHYVDEVNRWLEISVAKMDEEHLINAFTDVTDIKSKEIEVEDSEKILKDIVETQLNIVALFTPVYNDKNELTDFRIKLLNRAAEKFTKKPAADLIGKNFGDMFPVFLKNGAFNVIKNSFVANAACRFNFNYNNKDMASWFDILATPLQNNLMVCLQDLTDIKKVQIQLEKSVEELKRSNVMLEEFAYASSHDLKEPLRKIKSFSDRLKNRLLSRLQDDEKEMFERLERSATRMELLVEDLLAYSHVSQVPVELDRINMNEKIQRILDDLELAISEKGAKILVGKLPEIAGHRRQIQQLFHNLISNSLKYSKKDISPEISIEERIVTGNNSGFDVNEDDKNKQFHLFEIKDNGIGFEQKYADKIFQMFQRLHGKSEYSGTGVGLSIVKKVTENHHGYITADGEPGVGATFKVLLPVT